MNIKEMKEEIKKKFQNDEIKLQVMSDLLERLELDTIERMFYRSRFGKEGTPVLHRRNATEKDEPSIYISEDVLASKLFDASDEELKKIITTCFNLRHMLMREIKTTNYIQEQYFKKLLLGISNEEVFEILKKTKRVNLYETLIFKIVDNSDIRNKTKKMLDEMRGENNE